MPKRQFGPAACRRLQRLVDREAAQASTCRLLQRVFPSRAGGTGRSNGHVWPIRFMEAESAASISSLVARAKPGVGSRALTVRRSISWISSPNARGSRFSGCFEYSGECQPRAYCQTKPADPVAIASGKSWNEHAPGRAQRLDGTAAPSRHVRSVPASVDLPALKSGPHPRKPARFLRTREETVGLAESVAQGRACGREPRSPLRQAKAGSSITGCLWRSGSFAKSRRRWPLVRRLDRTPGGPCRRWRRAQVRAGEGCGQEVTRLRSRNAAKNDRTIRAVAPTAWVAPQDGMPDTKRCCLPGRDDRERATSAASARRRQAVLFAEPRPDSTAPFAFQEELARFCSRFHSAGEQFKHGQQCQLDRGDCRVREACGAKRLSPSIEIEEARTPRQP